MYQVFVVDPPVSHGLTPYCAIAEHPLLELAGQVDSEHFPSPFPPDIQLLILEFTRITRAQLDLIASLRSQREAMDIVVTLREVNASDMLRLHRLGVFDILLRPYSHQRFSTTLERFLRRQQLSKVSSLSQKKIDHILWYENRKSEYPLEKGLSIPTLILIRDFMYRNRDTTYSVEDITELLPFSQVTLRRYLAYLVSTGELSCTADYTTGGRPASLYKVTDSRDTSPSVP